MSLRLEGRLPSEVIPLCDMEDEDKGGFVLFLLFLICFLMGLEAGSF